MESSHVLADRRDSDPAATTEVQYPITKGGDSYEQNRVSLAVVRTLYSYASLVITSRTGLFPVSGSERPILVSCTLDRRWEGLWRIDLAGSCLTKWACTNVYGGTDGQFLLSISYPERHQTLCNATIAAERCVSN